MNIPLPSGISPRTIGGCLLLVLTSVQISAAQEIVNSVFTGPSPYTGFPYNDPAYWSPPEVPNNSPAKNYNVTLRSLAYVSDIDPTVSNLVIDSESGALNQQNRSFRVIGTTSINRGSNPYPFPFDDIAISSYDSSGASFVTDSLSTFSGGTLGGRFTVSAPNPISGSAILQFQGADVRTLTGALVLQGPLTRLIDEAGNDGLRNLTQIAAGASLSIAGHQMSVAGPFTNDGGLSVDSAANQPGLFTITGTLTNFDPATRTLKNGGLSVGGDDGFGVTLPATIQFPGADIVHNGGGIGLGSPLAKIVDENGADALRNFTHNTATGFFSVGGFSFTKPGDFTNDGTLFVSNGNLTIQGELTNLNPVTHTLTGGTYYLFQSNETSPSASLVFADADIQNNAASLYLFETSRIRDQNGNDALRNFAHNLPGGVFELYDYLDFIAPGDFTNSGEVQINSFSFKVQSHFILPKNHRYLQTDGATHLWGGAIVGDVEITGGSFDTFGGYNANPAVLTGNLSIGHALFAPRGLVVHGTVQLSDNSTFLTSGDSDNGFNPSNISVAGTLQIAAPHTPPPSTATFVVLQTNIGPGISTRFSNAPDGARIPTIDGLGSFVVSYGSSGPGTISISGYQALPAAGHLLNISTRAPVSLEDQVMVGGFIVAGTQPKKVIVRALGPSIPVLGALPDPVLELHDSSGALIASNDNWRTDQEAEIIATGVPPTNDLESAIVATLPANNSAYTAVVRGADNSAGIGVFEVYDLDRAADSKMENISTRGIVAEGDFALIGGLLVLNSNPTRVIVRALGPSLPLPGHLSDPTLSLYDSNGALIASNDNWRSDQEGEIMATGIPPGNDLEAAVVTTFPSFGGTYTAVVQGKDGATGVALVEIYDLSQ